jgi:hypothetical protein
MCTHIASLFFFFNLHPLDLHQCESVSDFLFDVLQTMRPTVVRHQASALSLFRDLLEKFAPDFDKFRFLTLASFCRLPCRACFRHADPAATARHLAHLRARACVVPWPCASSTQPVRSAASPPLYDTERIFPMPSCSDLFGRPPRLVADLIASRSRRFLDVFTGHCTDLIATSDASLSTAAHRTVQASCPKCPIPPTAIAIAAMLHLAPNGRFQAPAEHDPRTSR